MAEFWNEGNTMRKIFYSIAIVIILAIALAFKARAQTADTPLAQIPYSPALDVRDMDRTANPCQDFYQYSCGGWMKNNPIPADRPSWSVYAKLGQENYRVLWGIAQADAAMKGRTPVQQKVGDYFAACMNTDAVNADGIAPVQKPLAQLSAWKDKAQLTQFVAFMDGNGIPLFFNAGSMQDFGDSSKVIAGFFAGGLGLPDRDYYTKTDPKSVEIRGRYVTFVEKMLQIAGEPKGKAKKDAKGILAFETELAKNSLTNVEMREPSNLYHMETVAELQKQAPAFDWSTYLAAKGIHSPGKVNVAEPKFFAQMSVAVDALPLKTLQAYLRFHIVTAAAPYLPLDVQQADFDFYSKYLRGIPQMPPRWKKCIREEDRFMGEALGQEFVRVAFSAQAKDATVRMTDQIEAAMGNEIAHLDWMSDATRKEALAKLHAIRKKIGYPDQWRDYSTLPVVPNDYFADAYQAQAFEQRRDWAKVGKPLDRTEWGMSPPTVDAYFNPQMNDINFPAGVLQPPLYDVTLDDAPSYGDTGGTIGHELTHAFDDEGRHFDAQGNLRDWWTLADAKNFDDRAQCVKDQYAKYVVVDEVHINSKLTAGEDIADLGGELLAYIAWKAQTATMHLQPADGLTPDQRFFVGFAQWACENDRPEDAREHAMTNPHSPGKYRINGVVVNMPEFAKAFGCKAGDAMVSSKVCRIW
jgi:endothelin-converting enzyme/putative endopeptidase